MNIFLYILKLGQKIFIPSAKKNCRFAKPTFQKDFSDGTADKSAARVLTNSGDFCSCATSPARSRDGVAAGLSGSLGFGGSGGRTVRRSGLALALGGTTMCRWFFCSPSPPYVSMIPGTKCGFPTSAWSRHFRPHG